MVKIINATQARSNNNKFINETAQNHEPIIIMGKQNNVIMVSQEDWNVIQDMLKQKISDQIFKNLS